MKVTKPIPFTCFRPNGKIQMRYTDPTTKERLSLILECTVYSKEEDIEQEVISVLSECWGYELAVKVFKDPNVLRRVNKTMRPSFEKSRNRYFWRYHKDGVQHIVTRSANTYGHEDAKAYVQERILKYYENDLDVAIRMGTITKELVEQHGLLLGASNV